MAKKFAEYARERRADQTAEGLEAERVFRAAYAFGRVLYSARKARNLRQSDLADISRIERGMIAPTVSTLIKLADALGAQIQFVLPPADDTATDSDSVHEVFALSVGA